MPEYDNFIQANREAIEQVKNITSVIEKVINEYIEPAHQSLVGTLDSVEVDKETEKIVMRDKTQEQIFDSIQERLGTQMEQFEDRINKTYQMLDKLERIAHELNQKGNPMQGKNNLSTVSSTLTFFIDYYSRAVNILGYYSMLSAELERLFNVLKDSGAARALNRESMVEEAKAKAQRWNEMKQGAAGLMNNAYGQLQSAWNGGAQQQQVPQQPGYNYPALA